MSISFSCTGCGRTLKVADELAGRKAKCPQCQTVLYIPEGPAVAMTPTPARRHAAPIPPPQEEYDDRGEEMERRPRRRMQPKKSGMGVLLAVGAVVLVLLLAAGGFTAWWFWGGSPSGAAAIAAAQDLPFMPDGVQMVGQVHLDQVMNSDALKQVYAAFPDFKKSMDEASSKSAGVDANTVDRMYFGVAKADFGPASKAPAAIAVVHFKNSMKKEDLENGMKKGASSQPSNDMTMSYTFTDTKVGKYTMTEVKMAISFKPQPGFNIPPQPPTSMFAFAMPDDKRLVMGTTDSLIAVLTRDKKPEINATLQKAIDQTDWSASVAFAANVKDGLGISSAQVKQSGLPLDKVDAISATIKVGTDVDVSVTAMCKDASAASELSGGISKAIKDASNSPNMAKAPPEVKDLLNITPQVSGSNVTIAKTIKVAPLINLAKPQSGNPAPFNPWKLIGM